ncbi:MAG: hypothetical protein K2Q01_08050, partial [Rickettsiales bacterium]|nr:hypothetical protein [Rickettsiales bacterium]
MTNVSGIFNSKYEADQAVSRLLNDNFKTSEISLLMTDRTRDTLFTSTDDEATRAAKGGVTGAAIGGALGALIAGLTAVGSIVVTGGSVLVAGPIVAALSGAGAGGIVGGLGGALINAGFAADEANQFEEEINSGKAVVVVHC